MVLRGAPSLQGALKGVGPENRDFFGPARAIWAQKSQNHYVLRHKNNRYINSFKRLVASCHSFLFYYLSLSEHTYNIYIYNSSSSLPLSRGPPLGCRAEIRTRACLTASRRATSCATPHPKCHAAPWCHAAPCVPRRTLVPRRH
jgi:hypothetical protein